MNFRQITSSEEWTEYDYRMFAEVEMNVSDLEKKFGLEFEDFYAEGLGEAKGASFIIEDGTQFFITAYLPKQINKICIWCLNAKETLQRNLNLVFEVLEINSKDISFLYDGIELIAHELWRQDDNGHQFLIETFPCKSDAVREMKKFESRLHKQTYWVKKVSHEKI